MNTPASKKQIAKLQICWSQYLVDDLSRAARLKWASRNIGREIDSFNELTSDEACKLIEVLQIGLHLERENFQQEAELDGY